MATARPSIAPAWIAVRARHPGPAALTGVGGVRADAGPGLVGMRFADPAAVVADGTAGLLLARSGPWLCRLLDVVHLGCAGVLQRMPPASSMCERPAP